MHASGGSDLAPPILFCLSFALSFFLGRSRAFFFSMIMTDRSLMEVLRFGLASRVRHLVSFFCTVMRAISFFFFPKVGPRRFSRIVFNKLISVEFYKYYRQRLAFSFFFPLSAGRGGPPQKRLLGPFLLMIYDVFFFSRGIKVFFFFLPVLASRSIKSAIMRACTVLGCDLPLFSLATLRQMYPSPSHQFFSKKRDVAGRRNYFGQ